MTEWAVQTDTVDFSVDSSFFHFESVTESLNKTKLGHTTTTATKTAPLEVGLLKTGAYFLSSLAIHANYSGTRVKRRGTKHETAVTLFRVN